MAAIAVAAMTTVVATEATAVNVSDDIPERSRPHCGNPGVPCCRAMHESADPATVLIDAGCEAFARVVRTLRCFGEATLQFAADRGIRVVALLRTEAYATRSPSLRRLGIDVDGWPSPPAGLFVVEERTVYLRSHSAMTVAHEFGHALDCALGNGVYRSATDPQVKRLFKSATGFVTPYAATAPDEYFAECVRAYVEVNDTNSLWPRATRRRLRRIDASMYEYIQNVFTAEFVRTSRPHGKDAR